MEQQELDQETAFGEGAISSEDAAEIADRLVFEEFADSSAQENDIRPEVVAKAAQRLKEDAFRAEGTIKRDDVNRAYAKLGLTVFECMEVEKILVTHNISVDDEDVLETDSASTSSGGRSPVRYLSETDERTLARKIQLANKLAFERGVKDLEFERRVIAEAQKARELFVATNQRYVRKLARQKRLTKHLTEEDLYQEGMLGLLRATDTFDPDRGFRFKTYATWWIEQHIYRAIDNDDREVRLPVHLQEKLRKIRRSQSVIRLETGKLPDMRTLADTVGMDPERLGKLLWRVQATDCLEGDAEIGEDTTRFSLIVDEQSPSQLDLVAEQELARQVRQVLRCLSPREERILRLRFGIDGDLPETLQMIGDRYGLTRERIRQIEAKALRRLKHPTLSRRLRGFLDCG